VLAHDRADHRGVGADGRSAARHAIRDVELEDVRWWREGRGAGVPLRCALDLVGVAARGRADDVREPRLAVQDGEVICAQPCIFAIGIRITNARSRVMHDDHE
jgi:hypothetical protein